MKRPSVTVVMPAYNEAANLVEVVPATAAVLAELDVDAEILVVDDGSTDETAEVMARLSLTSETPLRHLRLRRNAGKSAALQTAFNTISCDLVVLMDADGQDSPKEIPRLLAAVDEGLDLVTGRRVFRNDRFVKRTTSRLYNTATRMVTGVGGRDFNSGLKAMRRVVVDSFELYGELHRYIPVLAQWAGFRVGEIDVDHAPRLHGTSKFGRSRFWRGFLDLVTVKFLTTYTARPFHLFGGGGIVVAGAGSALLLWMLVEKLLGDPIGQRPALQIGVLLVVVGVQLMSLGLIAELVVHLRSRRQLAFDVMIDEEGPIDLRRARAASAASRR